MSNIATVEPAAPSGSNGAQRLLQTPRLSSDEGVAQRPAVFSRQTPVSNGTANGTGGDNAPSLSNGTSTASNGNGASSGAANGTDSSAVGGAADGVVGDRQAPEDGVKHVSMRDTVIDVSGESSAATPLHADTSQLCQEIHDCNSKDAVLAAVTEVDVDKVGPAEVAAALRRLAHLSRSKPFAGVLCACPCSLATSCMRRGIWCACACSRA